MKPGAKLKSAACDTEVMVIRAANVVVECGGAPMVDERVGSAVAINPGYTGGTQLGKRYVDQAGTIELLCVKAGGGSLSIAGVALITKDAKALPSSD